MSTAKTQASSKMDSASPEPEHASEPSQSHRLPTAVRPTHYDLHLTPDMTTFVFHATVSIHLTVTTPTTVIHLNSAELKLHSATVSQSGPPQSAAISYLEDDEVAVLTVKKELQVGDAVLLIAYEGLHNDKMRGCYRSRYTSKGKDAYMCVTQFESTDARRALPCFDEPALKASFVVSLTVDEHLLAVSNMPITATRKEAGGKVTHTFDRTPVMSTYLLAWCVGELDSIETRTKDGTLIRCYTPVGKGEQGRFALQVAERILPFYNAFFETPYPLPKLDMLAIDDFAAGAMGQTRRAHTTAIDQLSASSALGSKSHIRAPLCCSENWQAHTHTHGPAQLSALSVHGPCLTFRTPLSTVQGDGHVPQHGTAHRRAQQRCADASVGGAHRLPRGQQSYPSQAHPSISGPLTSDRPSPFPNSLPADIASVVR